MFALCDCNNFYVSCERVFRPDLQGKPVVVLSNNDGCIVARSNEIKAMGIKMGEPLFKVKELVKQHNITVFSSNYELYADMSNRVMTLLSEFSPEYEIYSIDEIFLNLFGLTVPLNAYGSEIVTTIEKYTGIPVCLGMAQTKTLAKLANRFAKKHPAYNRVCIIDTSEKAQKALQLTEVGDVWGIGKRYSEKLKKMGIHTALQFTELSKNWVRTNMSIVGERIWRELKGESCLSLETVQPDKKQICTSRSFGQPVMELEHLSSAVAGYAEKCAFKLRKQKSAAVSLIVFISTNWFNKNLPQYHNTKSVTLPVPSSSTSEIVKFALMALKTIYRPQYQYKKAGVVITEITQTTTTQGSLFYQVDQEKHTRLMKAIDGINYRTGRHVVEIGAAGTGNLKPQEMRRDKLSPRYTTRIEDIITVKI